MSKRMLLAGWLACLTLNSPALSAATASVETRLAQQNALFDEQYESDLRARPELATAYGDYRYNDQLNDYSLAAIGRQHQSDLTFLDRLQAIRVSGFPGRGAGARRGGRRRRGRRRAGGGGGGDE